MGSNHRHTGEELNWREKEGEVQGELKTSKSRGPIVNGYGQLAV